MGDIDANNNRIQEIEERISDEGDTIDNNDTTVKQNAKWKSSWNKKSRKSMTQWEDKNLRIIKESGHSKHKATGYIFNKIIEGDG